jgi:hypothetical protein
MTLAAAERLFSFQEQLAREEEEKTRLMTKIYDLAAEMLQGCTSLEHGVLTTEIPVWTRGLLRSGLFRKKLPPMIIKTNVYKDNNILYANSSLQKEALRDRQIEISIFGLTDEEFEREIKEKKIRLPEGAETRSILLIVPTVDQIGKFNCIIHPQTLVIRNSVCIGSALLMDGRPPNLNELRECARVLDQYQLSMFMATNWIAFAAQLGQLYSPYAPRF